MNKLLIVMIAAAGCVDSDEADEAGVDGATGSTASFDGTWVARPYRWNVMCTNASGTMQGGSTTETSNISTYRLEVSGNILKMHVTDQPVGCVQLFSIDGTRATHTGDEGWCSFTVAGEQGPGARTTQSDVLTLSADGNSFDETVHYRVAYPNDYVCTGNDTARYFRR